jgi:hypothetical protein
MAFSIAWNEAYPAGSDVAAGIDTYIQQDKIAVRERMESLLGIANWAARDPMTADSLKMGGTGKIVSGATSLSIRNNADAVDMMLFTNATSAITIAGSLTTLSPTGGIGYGTGAGGTVTQATSKATAWTATNKLTGKLTFAADILNANTGVNSTMANSGLAATDVWIFNQVAGTLGAYVLNAVNTAGNTTFTLRNITGGNLTEAVAFTFAIIKGVQA